MTPHLVHPDMSIEGGRRSEIQVQVLLRSQERHSVSTLQQLRELYAALSPEVVIHVHISAETRPSWVSYRHAGRIHTATYTPAGAL